VKTDREHNVIGGGYGKTCEFFYLHFYIAVALALVNEFLKQIKNYHVKEKRNQLKFISNEFELSESELDIKLRANRVRPLN